MGELVSPRYAGRLWLHCFASSLAPSKGSTFSLRLHLTISGRAPWFPTALPLRLPFYVYTNRGAFTRVFSGWFNPFWGGVLIHVLTHIHEDE